MKRMSGKYFNENILGTNEVTIYALYLNLDHDNVKINLIDIPGNFDIINDKSFKQKIHYYRCYFNDIRHYNHFKLQNNRYLERL